MWDTIAVPVRLRQASDLDSTLSASGSQVKLVEYNFPTGLTDLQAYPTRRLTKFEGSQDLTSVLAELLSRTASYDPRTILKMRTSWLWDHSRTIILSLIVLVVWDMREVPVMPRHASDIYTTQSASGSQYTLETWHMCHGLNFCYGSKSLDYCANNTSWDRFPICLTGTWYNTQVTTNLALHDTNEPVTHRHWLWEIFSMVARVSGIESRFQLTLPDNVADSERLSQLVLAQGAILPCCWCLGL